MDELELLRAHRRAEAVPNPVARRAARERLVWMVEKDSPRRAAGHGADRPRFGRLTRVLLWAAAADAEILAVCPRHERRRHIAIGAVLLMSATTLAIVVTFALDIMVIAPPYVSVGCGMGMACGTLTLDRALCMWQAGRSRGPRAVIALLPRLILAVLLALVLSTPAMISLVRPEVKSQVIADRQQAFALAWAQLEQRQAAHDAPALAELRRLAASTDPHLEQRAAALRAELARSRRQADGGREDLRRSIAQSGGIMEQMRALDEIRSRDPEIGRVLIAFQLLLVLLLGMPAVLQAFASLTARTTYDRVAGLALASGLDPRVVTELVRNLADEEGVRFKALDQVTGTVNRAQGALAQSAVAEFKQREVAAFDGVVSEKS